jgi:DNA polymerase delta subunit 2
MFGAVSGLATFYSETNPTIVRLSSPLDSKMSQACDILLTAGQPLNDMFKYVQTPPTTRLDLAEATLLWRHLAPTAPDTLWCHPYFTKDPFVLEKTPDLYVIGNQPEFATKLVVSSAAGGEPRRCRVILLPCFSRTGILVLVDLSTLHVRTVKIGPL